MRNCTLRFRLILFYFVLLTQVPPLPEFDLPDPAGEAPADAREDGDHGLEVVV